jgi:hypothetical protein
LIKTAPRSRLLNLLTFGIVQGLLIRKSLRTLQGLRDKPVAEGMRLGIALGGIVFGGYVGSMMELYGPDDAKPWLYAVIDLGIGMFCAWAVAGTVAANLVAVCIGNTPPRSRWSAVTCGILLGAFTGGLCLFPIVILAPVGWFVFGGMAAVVGGCFGGAAVAIQTAPTSALAPADRP